MKKVVTILLIVLLVIAAGCSGRTAEAGTVAPSSTVTKSESTATTSQSNTESETVSAAIELGDGCRCDKQVFLEWNEFELPILDLTFDVSV